MRRAISLLLTLLTFLATQPNVQARWHSLLEKLVIKSVCLVFPIGSALLSSGCGSPLFICTVCFLLFLS